MFILFSLFCFFSSSAQLDFEFTEVASSFSNPVDIANDGFNVDRLYIVQQSGEIKLMKKNNGTWTTNSTNFLTITSKVQSGGEMGLLGMTFHPDFETNGYFYVNYTTGTSNATRKTIIERYTVNANGEVANLNSNFTIIEIAQPHTNHNAGDLEFGPDGMLYIALGDGGNGNDPDERSQDLNELLGKMLRLDVDGGTPYAIPSDNPYVNETGLDEIWSIGLRNPWRFSFDRLSGDIWFGDVGQLDLEEVSFQPANSTGKENYGWDCYEGNLKNFNAGEHPDCFDANGNPMFNHVPPVFEYGREVNSALSVVGGYVYRGQKYPNLQGHYFLAEYYNQDIWTIEKNGDSFDVETHGAKGVSSIASFGEDVDGELYLVSRNTGRVYQVTSTVLPIQLISFEGFYKNKQVELTWTSIADSQSSHFEIERSANGTDFQNIGKVQVETAPNNEASYQFTDGQATFSELYYRLKMVNKDGSFEYSKSVVIYFNDQAELSIFPNPNQGSFNLLIKGHTNDAKPVNIIIRTLTGKLVYQQKHLASLLPFDQQLFLENLPNGVYDVEVNFDGQVLRHQMVKSE